MKTLYKFTHGRISENGNKHEWVKNRWYEVDGKLEMCAPGFHASEWIADALFYVKGDTLNLKYYIIGPLRKLQEESAKFVIKEIVPIENRDDLKSLMPSFPGLSDAGHCREWETGVPIDLDKIRDKQGYRSTVDYLRNPNDCQCAIWVLQNNGCRCNKEQQ